MITAYALFGFGAFGICAYLNRWRWGYEAFYFAAGVGLLWPLSILHSVWNTLRK